MNDYLEPMLKPETVSPKRFMVVIEAKNMRDLLITSSNKAILNNIELWFESEYKGKVTQPDLPKYGHSILLKNARTNTFLGKKNWLLPITDLLLNNNMDLKSMAEFPGKRGWGIYYYTSK